MAFVISVLAVGIAFLLQPSAPEIARLRAGSAAVVGLWTVSGCPAMAGGAQSSHAGPVQGRGTAGTFSREKTVLIFCFLSLQGLLLHFPEATRAVPITKGLGACQEASTPFAPAGRYREYLMVAHGAHTPFLPLLVAGQLEQGGASRCVPP